MKKSLAAAILLLVCAVGGLAAVHADLTEKFEYPELTENILWGDAGAAEGLTVTFANEMDRRLFWESTVRPGQEPEHKASFERTQTYVPGDYRYDIGFQIIHNFTGGIMDVETDGILQGARKPVEDMLEHLEVGEECSRTVRFRDYYEFYPLNVAVNLPVYHIDYYDLDYLRQEDSELSRSKLQLVEDLNKMFRFPVPDDYTLELTVRNEGDGSASVECSSGQGGLRMWSFTEAIGKTVYFLPVAVDEKTGELADYSLTPGYGVYSLPDLREETDQRLTVDQVELAYPLPENWQVQDMKKDPFTDRLVLTTLEDGRQTVRVLDMESRTQVQELLLPESASVDYAPVLRIYEDFMVCKGEELLVYARDDQGLFHYDMSAPYPKDIPGMAELFDFDYYNGEEFAFDGQRLARVQQNHDREVSWKENCGGYVTVYDREGLTFVARYDSGLNRDTQFNSALVCRPRHYDPLTITFD